MKKHILALVALLLFLPFGFLQAKVEPVNIFLSDNNLRYDVPAGKVLIIEHFIWANESESTSQQIFLYMNNRACSLRFPDEPDMHTPVRPIRLISSANASVRIHPVVDWRDVNIVGLLVDPEDLYAAKLNTEIDSARLVGGKLVADVKFASPRPRVVKVESTESLPAFNDEKSAEVEETSSPGKVFASVPADTNRKFIRVLATTRETE